MHGVNRTHQQLRVLFRKGSVEREMDKEFRLHLAMEEEANVRNGMSPEEARRAALVSFGGVERFKEQARDERGGRLLDDVVLDFRYAVRRLRRRPLFATVAALTLGLGMGAATAMFSVVDGVLLKDLPFKESGRLVALWQTMPRLQGIPGDDSRRDIWFPIGAPGWSAFARGYSRETIGRLLPRVTVGQARAETQVLMSEHPDTSGEARVIPRIAEERRGLAPPLALLFGATAFLLLIACGNVATLSTAEALSRRHEIATRSALGAGAARILRLLLAESLVLAVLGSTVGTVLAFGGTRALVALAPPIPRLHQVAVKNATTIEALVAQSSNHERYRTLLTTFFGILATLACDSQDLRRHSS